MRNKYIFAIILSVAAISVLFTQCNSNDGSTNQQNSNKSSKVINNELSNQKLDLATLNTEFGKQQIPNNAVKEKVDTTARGIYIHQPSIKYIHKDYGYVEGMVVGRDSKNAEVFVGDKKVENNNGRFAVLAERPDNQNESKWTTNVVVRFSDGEEFTREVEYTNADLAYQAPTEAKEISKTTNTELTLKGTTLNITEGAVKTAKTISVSELKKEDMALIGNDMSNVTGEAEGYRFLPDGTKFEKELTIAMGYDKTKIPSGYTPNDIFTYYYDETFRRWQQLERDSINEEKQIVYSKTNHFTDYINGILKVPENSDVMAYTPTSIKDLEAAQPLNGITTIAPPQPNNKGTANLSYPITIPQGRRGMQPDLNITYSSSGGSSWLGLGWDLSVSSISVETRWGVPLYDQEKESETYLLDGETLVTGYIDSSVAGAGNLFKLNKPNYRLKWDIEEGFLRVNQENPKQYYPRVEGAFRKILRYGTTPQDYWWEIVGKDGTRYFYGSVDGMDMDTNSVLRGYLANKKNIAKWYLRKVVDVYDNTINYHYKLDKVNAYQMTLDYISYTGNEQWESAFDYDTSYTTTYDTLYYDEYNGDVELDTIVDTIITTNGLDKKEGLYRIFFETDTKPDQSVSFRTGFKETNNLLLDKIRIMYDTSFIKEYYFGYRKGGFDKSLLCSVYETDDSAKNQMYYHLRTDTATEATNVLREDIFNRCDFSISADGGGSWEYNPRTEMSEYKPSEFIPAIFLHQVYSFDYEKLPNAILETTERSISYQGTANPNLYAGLLPVNERKNFNASKAFSWNAGGGIDVGFGYNICSKGFTLGGNYAYTDEEAEGLVTLVDLNGDGYPDKLMKDGNALKYRLRIPSNDDNILFGELLSVNANPSLKKFQYSEGRTHNYGAEGQAPGIASFGANWGDSRTSTLVYLSDANADGLADIVDNGTIYYNQYYNTGTISFQAKPGSSDTTWSVGSCENDYVYIDGDVDTSIFSSGDYTLEHIVCVVDTIGYKFDTIWETIPVYDTVWAISKCNDVVFADGTSERIYISDTNPTFYASSYADYENMFGWYTDFHCDIWDTIYYNGIADFTPYLPLHYFYTGHDSIVEHTSSCGCDNDSILAGIDTIYSDWTDGIDEDSNWELLDDGSYMRIDSIYNSLNFGAGWGVVQFVILYPNGFAKVIKSVEQTYDIVQTDSCWLQSDTLHYQYPERFAPNIDLVRVWVAPYSGTINITDTAKLSPDFQEFRRMTNITDGVGLCIQKSDETDVMKYWTLTPEDSIQDMSVIDTNVGGLRAISVNKGDKIYFRMNSMTKREYDKVLWNPHIKYIAVDNYNNDLDIVDANGDSVFAFDYGTDYSLSQEQKTGAAFDSKFRVQATLTSNGEPLKEDLVFRIKKGWEVESTVHLTNICTDASASGTPVSSFGSAVIDTIIFTRGTILNEEIDRTIEMKQSPVFTGITDLGIIGSVCVHGWQSHYKQNENIFFELSSLNNGQQKWSSIDADVRVTIIESLDANYSNASLVDADGQINMVYHPSVNKIAYDYAYIPSQSFTAQSNSSTLAITPVITASYPSGYLGAIHIPVTLKSASEIIASATITGTSGWTFNNITLQQGKDYYIDYYIDNATVAGHISVAKASLQYGNQSYVVDAGLYTNYDTSYSKFGTMYRNWGQFGYRGEDNAENNNLFIDESLLVMNSNYTSMDSSAITNMSNVTISNDDTPATANISNGYNVLQDHFFFMNADPKNDCWTGYADVVYAAREYTGHTQVSKANDTIEVDNTASPVPAVAAGTSIRAVKKYTYNKSFGATGSVGVSDNVSIGGNYTDGKTRTLGDFMDMNGDRYPDVLSEIQIQYSKQRGGLGDIKRTIGCIDSSKYHAVGASFGATFLKTSYELGNNPKNSKSILSGSNGGSGSVSRNQTAKTLIDINGDGLPDMVGENGRIMFNNGYGWEECNFSWNDSFVRESYSFSGSASITGASNTQFNTGETSVSGGVGLSYSSNRTKYSLFDVNGDGLPDIVSGNIITDLFSDESNKVCFNTGNGFAAPVPLGTKFDVSHTTNIDGSLAFTIGFTIGPWPVKLEVNPKGGLSWNKTLTENQWVDMNNDGYPDYIYRGSGDELKVRYSQIGKTNLLNHVSTIIGSEYWISYKLSESTTNCPQRYWTMDSLVVYDGFGGDGDDIMRTAFTYKGRYYDRYERDEYGYDSVITTEYLNNQAYRKTVQRYHNDNFMFKGLLKYDLVTNANGSQKYVENIYEYRGAEIKTGNIIGEGDEPVFCMGDAYPVLTKDTTKHYEGSASLVTAKAYAYTKFGNVKEFKDFGIVNVSGDEVQSNISYKYDTTNNLYFAGLPDTITITSNGSVLRRRVATYTGAGALQTLKMIANNGNNNNIQYSYTYDTYGNTESVTMPANYNNQSMQIYYHYDTVVYTYPDSVSNSLGYHSTAEYDFRWGKPVRTTDLSGNQMEYTYDSKGRVNTIRAPKEIEADVPYTIKYDYWDSYRYYKFYLPNYSKDVKQYLLPFARTSHYDPEHPHNDIVTMTFADGLGRITQIQKDVEIADTERIVCSGWIIYDQLGRKIKQHQPLSLIPHPAGSSFHLEYTPNAIHSWEVRYFIDTNKNTNPPTQITYDVLDRPVTTTNPNGTQTTNTYAIAANALGINNFKTSVTNENGNTSHIFTDHRQLKTTIIDPLNHTTTFQYDPLGQLTQSTDPEGNATSYQYDMLGKMVGNNHPSMGQTTYEYDNVGNMVKQTMSSGEFIDYVYDYNRLAEVNYSGRYWNNVKYEYGDTNSIDPNSIGRLVKQQDATGVQTFVYGNMGEVVENHHTYITPNGSVFSNHTLWEYDSWNRVKVITYLDGEELIYSYNKGGLLKSIESNKNAQYTLFIKNIEYDEYEQRKDIFYGNEIITHYHYDQLMRRMTDMISVNNNNGQIIQKNHYTYDNVGNITQINGSAVDNFTHNYTYDQKNQLKTANGTGTWQNNPNSTSYNLNMDYSPVGRIIRKNLAGNRIDNNGSYPVMLDNHYDYSYPSNPYATDRIVNAATGEVHNFGWDSKGNMNYHKDNGNIRYFCWTEDNRLQATQDYNTPAYYNYDAAGERNLKLTGKFVNMTINGQSTQVPVLTDQVLYASALVTFNDKGYTKHYFTEGQRVCSAIGGGGLIDVQNVTSVEGGLEELQHRQIAGIDQTFIRCLPNVVVNIKTNDLYKYVVQPNEQIQNPVEPHYYYLTDHLGSSSYIVNDVGQITQTLAYMPYGEDMVNLVSNQPQYTTPYKFTGKEKDEETGFNYFGARLYYDYLSIWLSVDPMAHKYPHITSYNYCLNNPVKHIDPNGKDVWIHYFNGTQNTSFNYTQNRNNVPDNKFVQQTVNAIEKASEHNASAEKINYFHSQDKNNIVITEGNNTQLTKVVEKDGANYGLVEFNPQLGFKGGSKKTGLNVTSPFVLLFHEFGHLKDYYDDSDGYNERCNTTNFYWNDDEEKFNIQNNEYPLIDFFNEQLPKEKQYYKRQTYNRDAVKTKTENSTSNKEI